MLMNFAKKQFNPNDPRDPQDPNEASEPNDATDPNEGAEAAQGKEPYIYANPKPGGFNLMGGEDDEAGEGEPVSPQEQAQYNDVVSGGMSILYSDPNHAATIAKNIANEAKTKGLAVAMGQQTALIMLAVVRGLKQKGADPDPDVVQHAGMEILAEIYEICERTSQIPEGQEEQIKQDAMYEGTRFYGDRMLKSGEITPEMQQQARQAVEADIASKHGAPQGQAAPMAPTAQPEEQQE